MNDFLKSLVPMLGTAISTANPLAGMAFSAIGKVLGVDPGDKKGLDKAIQNATPEQLVELKKAEQEFSVRMAELGFNNEKDLEAIAAGDRDSARKREIAVHDTTPRNLAYVITAGYFSILGYIVAYGIPTQGHDAILMLLGTLTTAWLGACTYYYGSTSKSQTKDNTIASLSKG